MVSLPLVFLTKKQQYLEIAKGLIKKWKQDSMNEDNSSSKRNANEAKRYFFFGGVGD